MTRKSSFLRFIAVFMSYCPQFWGYQAIYNDLKTQYMFESYEQKLVVFVFYGHFHELLPTVWGSRWICMPHKNTYMFDSYDHKLVVFAFYCRFHELLPTVLGLQGNLQRP